MVNMFTQLEDNKWSQKTVKQITLDFPLTSSKWLMSMVNKSPKKGCSPSKWPKWLINGGYWLLTKWDDPPSAIAGGRATHIKKYESNEGLSSPIEGKHFENHQPKENFNKSLVNRFLVHIWMFPKIGVPQIIH